MGPGAGAHLLLLERIEGGIVVSFAESTLTSEEVVHELEEQLLALAEQAGATKILISFRNVRFMSSAVLGILVRLARKLGELGGSVQVCSLAPGLEEVFRAARLDRRFAINEHESTALDSF